MTAMHWPFTCPKCRDPGPYQNEREAQASSKGNAERHDFDYEAEKLEKEGRLNRLP